MSFKKSFYILSFLAVFGLVFYFPSQSAQAVTVAELQALLQQLRQQIAQIQQQLAQIDQKSAAWCYDFNINLRIGDSGANVTALQTALEKEGFYQRSITGNFDEYTASAAVGFQEKYKGEVLTPWGLVRGSGFIGTTTRAKFNKLYGCTVERLAQESTPAPILTPTPAPILTPIPVPTPITFSATVVSPNGGEQWEIGKTYAIQWSTIGYGSDATVQIRLTNTYDTSKEVAVVTTSNTGSYSWTIPSRVASTPTGAGPDYMIQIYVKPANEGWGGARGTTDKSNNYFSIVPSSSVSISITPSIVVTYPTRGEILQKGATTYVNLQFLPSVPLGGFVINLVRSDIDIAVANLKFCGVTGYTKDNAIRPNVSWQWKVGYDSNNREIPDGSYRIFVYDCGSQIDSVWTGGSVFMRSDIFSVVSPASSQPSITLNSFNGGEELSGNKSYAINWSRTGNLYSNLDILLGGYDQSGNQIDNWKLIVAGVSTTQGYYYWAPAGAPLYVPSTFSTAPDKYKIKIREATDRVDAVVDISDGYFSIILTDSL